MKMIEAFCPRCKTPIYIEGGDSMVSTRPQIKHPAIGYGNTIGDVTILQCSNCREWMQIKVKKPKISAKIRRYK
jgi:hypothetical protein